MDAAEPIARYSPPRSGLLLLIAQRLCQAAVHMDEAETPTPVEPERVDPQPTTRDDFGRVQSHNREWPATESPAERKDHVLGQGFGDSLPDPGSPVVPPLRLSTPGSVGSYASPASMMSRSGTGQDSVVARLKAQLADYIRLEHMHGAADRPRL